MENTIEKMQEIGKLTKHYFISMPFEDLGKFEENFLEIDLFEDEKILFNKLNNEINLFFSYITGRYRIFKVSEIADFLNKFGVQKDDLVLITRKFVVINSEKIYYLNSYGKFYKESIIYKPYLLKIGNLKHSKNNLNKRDLLISTFEKIIENSELINAQLQKIKVDEKFVLEIIEEIGIRLAKDFIGISNERVWTKMEEEEKLNLVKTLNINNISDLLNFTNNIIAKAVAKESSSLGDILDKVSQRITEEIEWETLI
jgi:hypothetical protein